MKISIIIASYNYARYIENAINSVINQTYKNWELIIIDDGSSDNSVKIIKSYCEKDNRIKLFEHKNAQNKGLKETVLLGIKHTSTDWIAFLESDDFLMPDNLSKKVEIIKKYPDIKLIFNKVNFLFEEQRPQKKVFEKIQTKLSKMNFPKNMFYDFDIHNMLLTFSCIMVHTNTLNNINFNTPLDKILDYWLWIHLAHKNEFYYINEELTTWRLHPKSYILKGKNLRLFPIQTQAYLDVYNKQEKSLRLLLFIFYSYIKLFFVRSFNYFKSIL